MKQKLFTLNRGFFWLNGVLIAGFIVLLLVPLLQMVSVGQSALDIPAATDDAVLADSHFVPEGENIRRNIFDPTGQIWQAPMGMRGKRNNAAGDDLGQINAVIRIHGLQGVISGKKFVPVGGAVDGGNLQSLNGDGRVTINNSQGSKEIDINQNRIQKRQSVPIQIR